jgi:hypothetical protein
MSPAFGGDIAPTGSLGSLGSRESGVGSEGWGFSLLSPIPYPLSSSVQTLPHAVDYGSFANVPTIVPSVEPARGCHMPVIRAAVLSLVGRGHRFRRHPERPRS